MVRMLDQGAQSFYMRWWGGVPRVRGFPYNVNNAEHSMLIPGGFWKDTRGRRIFARPTATVTEATPVEATPTTTVDKKHPDRPISHDRRIIADVPMVNLGFA